MAIPIILRFTSCCVCRCTYKDSRASPLVQCNTWQHTRRPRRSASYHRDVTQALPFPGFKSGITVEWCRFPIVSYLPLANLVVQSTLLMIIYHKLHRIQCQSNESLHYNYYQGIWPKISLYLILLPSTNIYEALLRRTNVINTVYSYVAYKILTLYCLRKYRPGPFNNVIKKPFDKTHTLFIYRH